MVDTTSLARLTHIERFYCLLDRLCQRVGGSRSLGNLGGFHDWPRAAFISFLNPQRAAPTAEAALGSSASAHMRSVRGRAQLFASDLGSIAEP